MFQGFFWKCWVCLIVFLVSMPLSHSQGNFSVFSLQARRLETYFLSKNESLESQPPESKSWQLWQQGRAHAKTAGVGKWTIEVAASVGRETGWMERKARRAEHVRQFSFPLTNGERQLSLPTLAKTKSPYTTKVKSAFVFVRESWRLE